MSQQYNGSRSTTCCLVTDDSPPLRKCRKHNLPAYTNFDPLLIFITLGQEFFVFTRVCLFACWWVCQHN